MLRFIVFLAVSSLALHAGEPVRPFSSTLTSEQRRQLGLGALTAAQLAELDAAVAAYARGESTVAVQQAVREVEKTSAEQVRAAEKKAAETAVAEYRQKQEPGVAARALETVRGKPSTDAAERFTARIVGEFRGWSGGTYFPLENGQVWRQVGGENNELRPMQNAEVEIYKSGNGYWRLKYGGAWITVKRLQ